jgi:hypothetical protein
MSTTMTTTPTGKGKGRHHYQQRLHVVAPLVMTMLCWWVGVSAAAVNYYCTTTTNPIDEIVALIPADVCLGKDHFVFG